MATKPFDAPERSGLVLFLPVAAATTLYAGVLGAVDAAGRAVPASDTAGLRVIGRVEHDVFNAGGSAGDLNAQIKRGCFRYNNSATAAVDADDIGKICFIQDDITVAETSTHKVKAGRVVAVDANGVWVDTTEAHSVPSVVAAPAVAAPANGVFAGLNSTAVNPTKADFDALLAQCEILRDSHAALVAEVTAIHTAAVTAGIIT